MACGADASYIPEEKFDITDLMDCIYRMVEKFDTKLITRGLVLRYNIFYVYYIIYVTVKNVKIILTLIDNNVYLTRFITLITY